MKLTILFTAIAFFQVQASTLAQTVTLSGKDFTLKQVFAAIDKQTGYALMTNKGTLDASKPVTLTVHKMPLREFLDFVLKEEELEYEIEGKTIFLSKKNKVVSGGAPPERLEVYKDQEIITGQVINEDGAGLSGVSIFHKKMNKGTLTDAQGLFSIKAKKGDTLLFSIVGYADQQVKITGNILQVRMKVAHSVLDETQVTAYGKTSRRLSTGNISTVKGEDIQRQPVMTVQEALIGRVAGLTIERTSGNSAAPVKVRIRGTNTINQNAVADPLYVIDGIPVNMMNTGLRANSPVNMGAVQAGVVNTIGENPLLFLNPADIERVDVLKDADATAIYGSRGANGVILITTKRSKGGPTTVGVTVQKDVRFNQNYPRLLNTPEYLAVRREAFRNDGIEPAIGNAPDLTLWDSTKYTDWQRMLVGKGGATTVNVNVGGGEGQTRYSLSGGYSTLKDIMNNGGKNERISFNSSVSHRSRDSRFNFTLGNMISHTEVNSYAISSLGRLPPNAPDMYNNKGEFNFDGYRIGNTTFFPFAGIRQPSSSKTLSVNNQIQLDYELINGLNLSMTARYAFNTNDNINLKPSASIDPLSWALPMA
ncbi:MAG: TonB-dependent receptor plug domain-containing protein, partial [Pseudobacter sp.]|uniref:TonB-dependent receptor plug domain-containing protein n=1 Tax=Pseudobacter sp. TaxID=2045420 RepID=UPI003F7DA57E